MDIKEIINQRYAMPDTSLDKLRQCLTEVSYPKGFRVLESGKVEKNIFFIKEGIVRAYRLDIICIGKERTERVVFGRFTYRQLGAALCGDGVACHRGTVDFHVVRHRL